MSSKNILIDFIQYLIFVALVFFLIFYIILGDRFAIVSQFVMTTLAPLGVFGVGFLIKNRRTKAKIRREKEDFGSDGTVYLDYSDQIISDIILFTLPISIIIAALAVNKTVDSLDLTQAVLVFLVGYFWQRRMFRRRG